MSPTRLSRIESGIRVVLEFKDAFNRHDVAGMMALVTDDCVFESACPAPDGARYAGKDALTRYWQDFFRDSPDARVKVEETLGFGARCLARWRCDWTDAAGEKRYARGVDIFQVKGGLIAEQLSYVKGAGG